MKHGQFLKKMASVLLVVALLLTTVPVVLADETAEPTVPTVGADKTTDAARTTDKVGTYLAYYKAHLDAARPSDVITLTPENVTASETDNRTTECEGKTGTYIGLDNKWVEWTVVVPTAGAYNLSLDYYAMKDSGRDINLNVLLDGKTPFTEAATLSLSRLWKDNPEDMDGEDFAKDSTDNHLRPGQTEVFAWQNKAFIDPLGMYTHPYFFYFEAGTHVIRFEYVREKFAVASLTLSNAVAVQSYEEYAAGYDAGKKPTGEVLELQAEHPLYKSSSTLYALTDHQDAGTTPNDPVDMLLNTVGGTNWITNGQEITWQVPVTEEGWYTLAIRARQKENQGMVSYRTLKINGEIPFAEAENLSFAYDLDWVVSTVGTKENPFKLYLKPGDTITLTCTPGLLCDVLRTIQQSVLDLNQIYREIIVITGTSPDIYQDYYLEDEIPGLKERFIEQQAILTKVADDIFAVTGKDGSQTSTLRKAAEKIGVYSTKSYEITANLSEFKSTIESMSSLLLTFGDQPLEVDCFYFVPEGKKVPSGKVGFFEGLWFEVEKFFGSFFNDYQDGTGGEDTVTVWVATGRDQLQIVNSLITDFTNESGVPVRLALVDTGDTLIQATMAGKGPDVALMVAGSYVIDLAMRGALVDLSGEQYGIKDIWGDFDECAWKSYYYNGGYYGIPVTQAFSVLFYRTDIMQELGLEPPKTWEEFYEMLRTLQGRNMNFGMTESAAGVSASINVFQSLLFQNGSDFYTSDFKKTRFDEPVAFDAFEQWAEFYSKYGVARSVDFYNRIRTGDVPIGISSYALYNQLMAAAPELRGLWKMAPIPGTVQEDGTINNTVSADGTGCMMLKAAEKRGVSEGAYKFLKWWASPETQQAYGEQLEATMGVAARYTPAATEAYNNMGWTLEEKAILDAQRANMDTVYQIPGDYLVGRSITNAVRAALDQGKEPRRMLSKYNRDINAEITRKRKEFGLEE